MLKSLVTLGLERTLQILERFIWWIGTEQYSR